MCRPLHFGARPKAAPLFYLWGGGRCGICRDRCAAMVGWGMGGWVGWGMGGWDEGWGGVGFLFRRRCHRRRRQGWAWVWPGSRAHWARFGPDSGPFGAGPGSGPGPRKFHKIGLFCLKNRPKANETHPNRQNVEQVEIEMGASGWRGSIRLVVVL